jgi:undecaprenyl diphosphate synthase
LQAVNACIVEGGEIATEQEFARHLWTSGFPDPELVLRTGGKKRLSNFLPWQTVYSELYFTDTLWPEITRDEFLAALSEYTETQRNFGT